MPQPQSVWETEPVFYHTNVHRRLIGNSKMVIPLHWRLEKFKPSIAVGVQHRGFLQKLLD
jgi:hypothetical protein